MGNERRSSSREIQGKNQSLKKGYAIIYRVDSLDEMLFMRKLRLNRRLETACSAFFVVTFLCVTQEKLEGGQTVAEETDQPLDEQEGLADGEEAETNEAGTEMPDEEMENEAAAEEGDALANDTEDATQPEEDAFPCAAPEDDRASSGSQASAAPGPEDTRILHVMCYLGSRDRTRMIQLPVAATARTLLHIAAAEMGADASLVSGIYKGSKLDPDRTFDSHGLQDGDAIEVDILQGGLDTDVLVLRPVDRGEVTVKVLDVEVESEGATRLVQVVIDGSQMDRKKYLGGYRNKKTGATFHHASSQTTRVARWTEADRKLTRETQTVKVQLRSMQAVREAGTQMPRPDLVVDGARDRAVAPRPYVTAAEVWALKERKAIVIQRYTRGWFARRRAARLRADKRAREESARAEAERRAESEEARTLREIQRRMHPKTREDFEILRSEVEKWRDQETRRIKGLGLDADQEHLSLEELLYKETKLLQTIDRLKVQAQDEIRAGKVEVVLQSMAAPRKWAVGDGSVVEVHTPFTTRARELMQLYQGLTLPVSTVDARLNVLLHVKYTVKEFDCSLTREIVDLVDREADLLNRVRTGIRYCSSWIKYTAPLSINVILSSHTAPVYPPSPSAPRAARSTPWRACGNASPTSSWPSWRRPSSPHRPRPSRSTRPPRWSSSARRWP